MPVPRKSKEDQNKFDPLNQALRIACQSEPITSITKIDDLLDNEQALNELAEAVSCGASIMSIGMLLGLEPGMLERWLLNGRTDRKGPFRIFYLFYRRAASNARMAAEAKLLSTNPDKWLAKYDVEKELDEINDGVISSPGKIGTTETPSDPKITHGFMQLEIDDEDDPTGTEDESQE